MTVQKLLQVVRPLNRGIALVVCASLTACGDDRPGADNASSASAAIVTNMDSVAASARRLEANRQTRGDTVAMDVSSLQAMLPTAPDGYEADGAPAGIASKAGGFGVTEVRQKYVGVPLPNVVRPRIEVAIADLGSSQIGVSMIAERMVAAAPAETPEQRVRTRRLSIPYTWLSEEYYPQSHTAKLTAVTRFRYIITVTAQLQQGDPTAQLADLVAQIATSFSGM